MANRTRIRFHEVQQLNLGEPPEKHARLQCGAHFADVLVDTRSAPAIYHWIVQPLGSAEIVHWGHERSFEEAAEQAKKFLQSLLSDPQVA